MKIVDFNENHYSVRQKIGEPGSKSIRREREREINREGARESERERGRQTERGGEEGRERARASHHPATKQAFM